MLRQLDSLSLQRSSQRFKSGIAVQVHAHRKVVDERANDRFHTGQLGRPSGEGRAEDHVVAAGLLRQQNRPRALHQRVEWAFQATRERVELRRGRVAERCRQFIESFGAARLCRDRRRVSDAFQIPLPEATGGIEVGVRIPLQVVADGWTAL